MNKGTSDVKAQVEAFITNWNSEFPDYQLKNNDLKEPQVVIGALFQVLSRLGIDCEVLVTSRQESERDEHTQYYWDLLPFINLVRVVKHVLMTIPHMNNQLTVTLSNLLQPTMLTSCSLLTVLLNLMVFNQHRLDQITPYEEELFGKREQVKLLEDKKNKLQELLNEQAAEKAKRADKLAEIDHNINQIEEELKQEKELHDQEKQELEMLFKKIEPLKMMVDQKTGHRDALMAEVAKKRALRVYDADDIKAQASQAAQNVQDAEEKLESLNQTLIQKETALQNLQNIKPNLDSANTLLHEIMKLSESFKELESQDQEPDGASVAGELEARRAELRAAREHLARLRTAGEEARVHCAAAERTRQQESDAARSVMEEAEQKEKKCREISEEAVHRVQEIKQLTLKYEEDKKKGLEELQHIQEQFYSELKMFSDGLLMKTAEAEKVIEEKLKNMH